MRITKNILLIGLLLAGLFESQAQDKKIWASGAARSVFQLNEMLLDSDTVTPKMSNSGHALVDLAINARPNDQTFLHGMVRIRNDFGGFWGSGVSFDIRQLYVKGLIHNSIRYQLGDINYKLSPYTFYSNNEELTQHQNAGLDIFREMVHYDLFYTDDNTWRQQGAAVDFTLEFSKLVKELEFNMFASRNRPSDFAMQSDRLFFGGNVNLVQSDNIELGANYIDLMDISGTSQSQAEFHNPVITGTTLIKHNLENTTLSFRSESGISEYYEINSTTQRLRDYFYDLEVRAEHKNSGSKFSVGYVNVGPQFRAAGAQAKRLNFNGLTQLYGRYGNDQVLRTINQVDAAQDASLYMLNFNPQLQAYSPAYNNIDPYGKATPNRKGINVEMSNQYSEHWGVTFQYSTLSEVVGQGSDELRSFSRYSADFEFFLNEFIESWKKDIQLSVGYSGSSTKRSSDIEEGNIDLTTSIIDAGVRIELVSKFDLLANYRRIQAEGNELMNIRNINTVVEFYEPFETQLKEDLLLITLRYNFSETNTLNFVWQKLNWEDGDTKPAYGMNQLAVVYKLTF